MINDHLCVSLVHGLCPCVARYEMGTTVDARETVNKAVNAPHVTVIS